MPLDRLSLDVRSGGGWEATMMLRQDQPGLLAHGEFHMRGEYVEVDRPHKLVMTMSNELEGEERELLTVTFNAIGGGTEIVFSQIGRAGWPPVPLPRCAHQHLVRHIHRCIVVLHRRSRGPILEGDPDQPVLEPQRLRQEGQEEHRVVGEPALHHSLGRASTHQGSQAIRHSLTVNAG
ncbi:SRPBCC domain-containing protein [Tessaracoccus antarcticus]|uniref:SRPBCC domain-containing protein n=1 Tax=Tessaracoccus antarcticus TaxID=2479848 RepID=A0A3M0G1M4_9ACTN|nr:SRPBCC domain-containing protein [Tessaracoccus antarcticus]